MPHTLTLLLLTATLLASSVAAATPACDRTNKPNKRLASDRFHEGMAFMEADELDAACARLEEALCLAWGDGIQFQLAECEERRGRVATALALYADLERRVAGNEAKLALVAERMAELAPRVSRLAVTVADRARGQRMRIGSEPLRDGMAIDPGVYVVEVSAPKHKPYRQQIHIDVPGTTRLTIPKLVEQEPEVRILRPEPVVAANMDVGWAQVPGWVTLGSGGALLGAAAIAGGVALDRQSSAEAHCPLPDACYTAGAQLMDDAHHAATAATALTIAGGAVLTAGIALLIADPWTPSRGSTDSAHSRSAHSSREAGYVVRW